ncbi:medium-chain fatty acid-CoA ligase faa2 [Coemansia erecta]|uniref:Medium-chain fatty acid-CoA ligase faa2 n=1 Tax=Coemansia erecta TaxID=147472 RepID=A0A9W7XX88_9FUNG|nr:medium-chain fatty acid-CoA ligase faa2 [Coemansia erecta]
MFKSYVVPSSETPGHSPIYRHPKYKSGTLDCEYPDIGTLYNLFTTAVKNYSKEEFLGSRRFFSETDSFGDYEWMTAADAAEFVNDFGSGLDNVYSTNAPGVNAATGQQPLGIFSVNRPEWLLSELAAFRSRRYSVGIIDAPSVLRAEADICSASIEVIVCSVDKIPRMLDRISLTPSIKVVISMDKLDCSRPTRWIQPFDKGTTEKLKIRAKSLGIVLLDIDEVIQIGRLNPTEPMPPRPFDICTLCFSSGTTGAQKGILSTHEAFVHSSKSAILAMPLHDSTYMSYISLFHIFDRYTIYALMFNHLRIGFYSGDNANLLDDIQLLQPTIMSIVPFVLNRIYDKVAAATVGSKGLVGFLSRKGFKAKIGRIRSGKGFKHALWDRLIFDKVAALFGGRVQIMVSGSAYLDPKVQDFFRVGLSCNLVQGYGQTEIMAGGTIQTADDISTANIGIPNPGVDICLRSIPEIGYNVTDVPCPRGELMIRAKNMFLGYYMDPEKTAEAMDGEWLATGDVAQINADGSFSIIDRIKSVIKIARLMWVEPTMLEAAYSRHRLVSSVFIYGNEHEREIVAVVVPNPDTFVPWARSTSRRPDANLAELCADKRVAISVADELRAYAILSEIPIIGIIGGVYLEPKELAQVDSEFVTSTLKVRRAVVSKHYMPVFEQLYKELDCNDDPTI